MVSGSPQSGHVKGIFRIAQEWVYANDDLPPEVTSSVIGKIYKECISVVFETDVRNSNSLLSLGASTSGVRVGNGNKMYYNYRGGEWGMSRSQYPSHPGGSSFTQYGTDHSMNYRSPYAGYGSDYYYDASRDPYCSRYPRYSFSPFHPKNEKQK